MKRIILLIVLVSISVTSFSDSKITRGPDIGEIYFLGPTYSGEGLYYSSDFGETAVCVDSINFITSITADKSQGGIYCVRMPSNLYYSENYGNSNSWVVKNGGVSDNIECGTSIGHIFSNFYSHSENYGLNFIYHTCNGYFGDVREFGVDFFDDNNGYVFSVKLTNADTSFLFRTFDKFENVEVIQEFYFPNGQTKYLFSGSEGGEVYTYFREWGILNLSTNYAENFNIIDKFNFHNFYSFDLVGGPQIGDLYILYNFANLMWQNAHIYIYHSTDYGKTFEVFHPFAKGNEPVLSNFSTLNKEVHITDPVEFSNFSIGDIQEYQWDFENDGVIDSYKEFPVYMYQDTGWYSVKLSVIGPDSSNSFIKENYIHVIDTTTIINKEILQKFSISPNPIKDKVNITYDDLLFYYSIFIYNLKGEKVLETYNQSDKSFTINTSGLNSGVYILNIVNQKKSTNYKIIKK